MGQAEENTPLNTTVQDEPQQPQNSQQQYAPLYPNMMPGYAYQNNMPMQYAQPNFPPQGYVLVPTSHLQQPILARRKDRVGSETSHIVGALLGFFFPIFSLVILCCSSKLRIKHGVCVGHAIYYVLTVIGFVVLATLYSSQVVPYMCQDVDGCVDTVMNGTDSQNWGTYVEQCNYTYVKHHHDELPQYTCDLPPYGTDFEDMGPQTLNCATCVCDMYSAGCQNAKSFTMFAWFSAPCSILLAILFVCASRHYKHLINEESMSVYRL